MGVQPSVRASGCLENRGTGPAPTAAHRKEPEQAARITRGSGRSADRRVFRRRANAAVGEMTTEIAKELA